MVDNLRISVTIDIKGCYQVGDDMASVLDVAQYILQKQGRMTTMKLQKLVYYSQAWSLVWDVESLFPEKIQAWANGPVVRELYDQHTGVFQITSLRRGNPDTLTDTQRETIDAVLEEYGNRSAQWLSDLTHLEEPWNITREGLAEGENSEREITPEILHNYYSSLPSNPDDSE
ncbi:Panacea domain-containing protein [Chloroflexota bacterium]